MGKEFYEVSGRQIIVSAVLPYVRKRGEVLIVQGIQHDEERALSHGDFSALEADAALTKACSDFLSHSQAEDIIKRLLPSTTQKRVRTRGE